MDYEKKYKDALEWARKVIQGKVGFVLDEVLEKFPELKESEDERIRKAMIKGLSSCGTKYWGGFEVQAAIDYLEKQGEQKPADNIEPTVHNYITPNPQFFQWIYNRLIHIHNENPSMDYMLSLKERIENMQKTAWSVEDEDMLDNIIDDYDDADEHNLVDDIGKVMWLKALKDRVTPQPKQEWSEEDEKIVAGLNNCIDELEEANGWRFTYVNDENVELCKIRNWLKLLKERVGCEANCTTTKQWKPSKEQIKALERECMAHSNYDLCRLYEQLKKLKG